MSLATTGLPSVRASSTAVDQPSNRDGCNIAIEPRISATCDFHVPLQFEDEIEIELIVAEVRTKSIRYRFYFWKHPDGERVRAATGEIVVVSVIADRAAGTIQSSPIPEVFRDRIEVHPQAEAGGAPAPISAPPRT